MIGDSDNVFAVVVSAETFELLDTDGNVVAQFGQGEPYIPFGDPSWGIDMAHYDSGTTDSRLGWTVADPRNGAEPFQLVWLRGPREPGLYAENDFPAVALRYEAAGNVRRAQLLAGASLSRVEVAASPGLPGGMITATADVIFLNPSSVSPANALMLNSRPAFLATDMGSVVPNANLVMSPGTGAGVFTAVPGCATPVLALTVGDRVLFNWTGDIRHNQLFAGTLGSSYGLVGLFANGVLATARSAYLWTEALGGNNTVAGTPAQNIVYTVPATGNYTFDLRGQWGGVGATAPSSIDVNAAHTVLTWTVFRTR